MIKILDEPQTKTTYCYNCATRLEYSDEDMVDVCGGVGIVCPKCGGEIVLGNPDKPIFPVHFYHFGSNDGAVPLTDEETQHYVDEVFEDLKQMSIGEYCFTGTGDTMVFGVHHEDEIVIWVSKNFYDFSYSLED